MWADPARKGALALTTGPGCAETITRANTKKHPGETVLNCCGPTTQKRLKTPAPAQQSPGRKQVPAPARGMGLRERGPGGGRKKSE